MGRLRAAPLWEQRSVGMAKRPLGQACTGEEAALARRRRRVKTLLTIMGVDSKLDQATRVGLQRYVAHLDKTDAYVYDARRRRLQLDRQPACQHAPLSQLASGGRAPVVAGEGRDSTSARKKSTGTTGGE